MRHYSEELQRRLASGEPFAQIANWYCNCQAQRDDQRHYDDLPRHEQVFIDRLNEWFREEMRTRRS